MAERDGAVDQMRKAYNEKYGMVGGFVMTETAANYLLDAIGWTKNKVAGFWIPEGYHDVEEFYQENDIEIAAEFGKWAKSELVEISQLFYFNLPEPTLKFIVDRLFLVKYIKIFREKARQILPEAKFLLDLIYDPEGDIDSPQLELLMEVPEGISLEEHLEIEDKLTDIEMTFPYWIRRYFFFGTSYSFDNWKKYKIVIREIKNG